MSETDLTGFDAAELATRIHAREISAAEVTEAHLARIAESDTGVNAFLYLDAEGARATARQVDAGIAAGEAPPSPLAGVPVALQDAFVTEGLATTCGSLTLQDWVPPYDATVTRKLRDGGTPILGKTNMDEFAMGASTEYSAFGPTRNPWNPERVPGGSGGGSVASTAAFETPLSVGVDGGGSIRQPGALSGTVTVRPTYGGISRYGQVAAASSLDQAGPCARTVTDVALLHELIGGHDPLDSMSRDTPVPSVLAAAREGALGDLTGTRIGVIGEFAAGTQTQEAVSRSFQAAVAQLRALGAEVVEVSCPQLGYGLSAHCLIGASECSSNLARFDAMRYGLRAGDDGSHGADRVTALSRENGFGAEVKRRLLLGTHALSDEHYEHCYGAAQRARTLVCRDLDSAFSRVDVLVSPTSPTTAVPLGAQRNDPMGMYRSDRFTVPAGLAGTPAMTVPSGLADDDEMPVGLQIMAPAMADERMYRVGAAYERARDEASGIAFAARLPDLKGGAVR